MPFYRRRTYGRRRYGGSYGGMRGRPRYRSRSAYPRRRRTYTSRRVRFGGRRY